MSSISLTSLGWFIWGGRDFTHSAREIHLEHGANGPHLTAELPMRDGGYRERQGIDLADKIRNENGRLIFLVSGQEYSLNHHHKARVLTA